jgi:Tfp pilus assembly protein PilV
VAAMTGRKREAGFSIIEVLFAGLLLLFIALGILPLFARSIVSNLEGQDSTNAANFTRSRLEEFKAFPFEDPKLAVLAGTERQFDEVYLANAKKWMDGTAAPIGDWASWSRTTIVRQYLATDLELKSPLPSSTDPSFVQIKEVEVSVISNRNSSGGQRSFGSGKRLTARFFKTI